jgi:hypothetical protein
MCSGPQMFAAPATPPAPVAIAAANFSRSQM